MCERAKFKRNFRRIELIITYSCNMKCYNCDAMVRQAPSKERMSLKQVEKFIKESINNDIKWEVIRILGGEPTVHPEILEILNKLIDYKKSYSPNTLLCLVTNGNGDFVKNKLKQIEVQFPQLDIENSQKTSNLQLHFSPINQAPIDLHYYKNQELNKGCWITSVCGIALSMHGYYPCTTSASIDRIFGFDLGRKKLPSDDDLMDDLFQSFCQLCGHYYHELNDMVNFDIKNTEDYIRLEKLINTNQKSIEEIRSSKKIGLDSSVSKTWDKTLSQWKKEKRKLSSY
ncbi:radical SAM protein [Staphylococcus agnetis]|uniref:radical SAM protein n=1 Tax=Staphylococcus agnetis TaxID=985762 RepID=UPI0014308102|nr:radical SAM protein [Staphylococcus agnetis]NJH85448.1 radical SAM protein [Staphylococcus agnetis]NJI15979.1 radical SAM protein [Staphylococcus agnetis]